MTTPSTLITKIVEVTSTVTVTINPAQFTAEFMAEFRDLFYAFDDIDDHIKHLAQLAARELLHGNSAEGYGPLDEMEIQASVLDRSTEIVS